MTALPPTAGGCYLMRVVASEASPLAPGEVAALARVDLVMDESGVGIGSVYSHAFDALGCALPPGGVASACTPMHVAMTVWEHGTPDVLVAHDASTASLLFGPALTRRLPWVSLHKLARCLWPAVGYYGLDELAQWRGIDRGAASFGGVAREAYLTAHLLAVMLQDRALATAGQPLDRTELARQKRAKAFLSDLCRDDALQAAVRVSSNPGPPLRASPGSWNKPSEWYSYGREDLQWFASGRDGKAVAAQARAELARRALEAVADPRWQALLLRRSGGL